MTERTDYNEKLKILRRIHTRSSAEARATLEKWGDELQRLETTKEWIEHPNTAELRETLTDQLDAIVSVLSNDPKLDDAERKAFFKTKDVILALLAVLSQDPESEAAAIRESIDEEL